MVRSGLRLLEPADAAQGAVDLVLGVLADGAGVVEDRVGLVDVVGQLVPVVAELADDELAVEHVHLTADRLDVELLLRGGGFGSGMVACGLPGEATSVALGADTDWGWGFCRNRTRACGGLAPVATIVTTAPSPWEHPDGDRRFRPRSSPGPGRNDGRSGCRRSPG